MAKENDNPKTNQVKETKPEVATTVIKLDPEPEALLKKIGEMIEMLRVLEIKEILIEIRDLLKEEKTVTAELAEVKPATSEKVYAPKKRVKKQVKQPKNK